MDLIINSNCLLKTETQLPVATQGSWLLNLLAYAGYDPENPPMAALLSQYHELHGNWVVVSPIYWEAFHNNAMITAMGEQLAASEDELSTYFHQYAEFLRAEGMALYYHDPYTWLISAPNKACLQAKPVQQMIDRPLINELSQIDATLFWQKLLTESQMFFASQPVQSKVNGVWFWGAGTLGDKKSISICTTEDYCSISQCCSTSVSLYNEQCILQEFDLLLIKELSVLSPAHQQQLKKIPATWRWNDNGYTYCPSNWLSRLWRTLTYAH
jgi:hypothetical protein